MKSRGERERERERTGRFRERKRGKFGDEGAMVGGRTVDVAEMKTRSYGG